MPSRLLSALTFTTLLAGAVQAAEPMPQPTQEQAQQAMMRQMQMMAAMFDYRRSKLGFDETVKAVADSAGKRGWTPSQVQDLQAAMQQPGTPHANRMKVVSSCPKDANEKLARASGAKLPPLPCRYTIFEGRDGKTYVVRMNTHMLAKNLQGGAAKAMEEVAADEDGMLKGIVE